MKSPDRVLWAIVVSAFLSPSMQQDTEQPFVLHFIQTLVNRKHVYSEERDDNFLPDSTFTGDWTLPYRYQEAVSYPDKARHLIALNRTQQKSRRVSSSFFCAVAWSETVKAGKHCITRQASEQVGKVSRFGSSGKALGWYADRPWFESASALLSL